MHSDTSHEYPASYAAQHRLDQAQNSITSTCLNDAPEGTPSRRQVEASCEVLFANQTVPWGLWAPSQALWLACLSPAVCVSARMCRRPRARRVVIARARNAVRAARSGM